jgi:lipoate-protein ligase A
VVIGRFQNPWLEINVPYAKENQINIARRVSGGGTVYHDPGNINLSFITSRKEYSRKKNLGIICDAVRSLMPQTNVFVNDRDDIILGLVTILKIAHDRKFLLETAFFNPVRRKMEDIWQRCSIVAPGSSSSLHSPC